MESKNDQVSWNGTKSHHLPTHNHFDPLTFHPARSLRKDLVLPTTHWIWRRPEPAPGLCSSGKNMSFYVWGTWVTLEKDPGNLPWKTVWKYFVLFSNVSLTVVLYHEQNDDTNSHSPQFVSSLGTQKGTEFLVCCRHTCCAPHGQRASHRVQEQFHWVMWLLPQRTYWILKHTSSATLSDISAAGECSVLHWDHWWRHDSLVTWFPKHQGF